MISVSAGLCRTPGNGQFTCCARRHTMTINGVLKTIPCDRSSIGSVVWKMVRSKSDDRWLRGDMDESRLWQAFTPHFMQGLSCEEMAASSPATSVTEFLDEYRIGADDANDTTSGITPLLLAVVGGNSVVVQALAQRKPSDATVRVKSDFRMLSITAGMTPLHLAVAICSTNHTEIVTALLEHGADPNAAHDKAGLSPLYCAASTHNLNGLNALILCAGDRLQIEKGNAMKDTALGAAVFSGTPVIVEALLAANADPGHIMSFGSSKLMSACENPSATIEMLARLCGDVGTTTINLRRIPRAFAWSLTFRFLEIVVRLRSATSEFIVDLAHNRGATALHAAARHGHTPLVKWLLDNGARPSLHVKNAMGCTPLDVSHLFGPFPETEAVLTRAILKERAISSDSEPEEKSVVTVRAPLLYPMYLLPVRTLLDLSVLPPHEELLAQDKLVEWRPTTRAVFYVSLEWTSSDHPDPGGKRLDVLKRLLSKMVQGRASKVEADWTSQAAFGKGQNITSADWRKIANDAHVWIRFCSAPTVTSALVEAAPRSFSNCIERSTHFFALCPPTKHLNDSNRTCDFRSWCDSGGVRVELSALFTAVVPKPAIKITGGDSPMTAIDVPRFAMSLLPGQGQFACCACDHVRISDDGGVSIPIPCEKLMAGHVVMDLLKRRIDHHRRRSECDEMRLWKALSTRFLHGLGAETPALPTNSGAFLREFEFVLDEADSSPSGGGRQSKRGVSPVLLAVMSGNLEVTRALTRANPSDVTAQLTSDFPELYLWTGFEPIHAAVAGCVADHMALIGTLLEGGADPNAAAGKIGITPLYAAAMLHNLEGTEALITTAGDRLKIEKGNRAVSDTVLGGAAYFSTPAVVDALLAAKADAAHIIDSGSTKVMLACENPAATPGMLASLCRDDTTIDICHRRRMRTCFWALIFRLFEMAVWLRLLTSNFAMGMAHARGGTALHTAAQFGHMSLVRWLLDHGARPLLHVKNAMGCTPLDVARVFGPYPETSALLVQAMLSAEFDARFATRPGGRFHLGGA